MRVEVVSFFLSHTFFWGGGRMEEERIRWVCVITAAAEISVKAGPRQREKSESLRVYCTTSPHYPSH